MNYWSRLGLLLLSICWCTQLSASTLTAVKRVGAVSLDQVTGVVSVWTELGDWGVSCHGEPVKKVEVAADIPELIYSKMLSVLFNQGFAGEQLYFEGSCHGSVLRATMLGLSDATKPYSSVGGKLPLPDAPPRDPTLPTQPYLCDPDDVNQHAIRSQTLELDLSTLFCNPFPEEGELEFRVTEDRTFITHDETSDLIWVFVVDGADIETQVAPVWIDVKQVTKNGTHWQRFLINVHLHYGDVSQIAEPRVVGDFEYQINYGQTLAIAQNDLFAGYRLSDHQLLGYTIGGVDSDLVAADLEGAMAFGWIQHSVWGFQFNAPAAKWGYTLVVNLQVRDGLQRPVQRPVTIHVVNPLNRTPSHVLAIPDFSIAPGVLIDYQLQNHFSDPDIAEFGDVVRYGLEGPVPTWIDRQKLYQEGRLYGRPTTKDVGSRSLVVVATDRQQQAARSNAFNLEVVPSSGSDSDGDGLSDAEEFYSLWHASRGNQAALPNGASSSPAVSDDGRWVVFASEADNLVTGDNNGFSDIFLFDRSTEVLEKISTGLQGAQANGFSFDPRISADGRFVSFVSVASNLVANDTNAKLDIFVLDRDTSVMHVASRSYAGQLHNGRLDHGYGLSPDGRFVAFSSDATNLVAEGNPVGIHHLYVRDLYAGRTERITQGMYGQQPNGDSMTPSLSAGGRYVSFYSMASNLVALDQNSALDMFRYDRHSKQLTLVSVDNQGAPLHFGVGPVRHSLSWDGRYAIWRANGSLLSGGPVTDPHVQLFLRDIQAGTTLVLTLDHTGSTLARDVQDAAISGNGAFVTYTAKNAGTDPQVYVLDRAIEQHLHVSSDLDGDSGVNPSVSNPLPMVSSDGRFVVFNVVLDLLQEGTQPWDHVYLLDRWARLLDPSNPDSDGDGAGDGWEILHQLDPLNGQDGWLDSDGDGLTNAEEYRLGTNPLNADSDGDGLLDGDERIAGSDPLQASGGAPDPGVQTYLGDYHVVPGEVFQLDLSRRVSFEWVAASLRSGASLPHWLDAQRLFRQGELWGMPLSSDAGSQELVIWVFGKDGQLAELRMNLTVYDTTIPDVDGDGIADTDEVNIHQVVRDGSGHSYPSLSADGRYLSFSTAEALVPEDTNGLHDVYVQDLATQQVVLVTRNKQGVVANAPTTYSRMSADGRYVVFQSMASNLVAGDANDKLDIFKSEWRTGSIELVSVMQGEKRFLPLFFSGITVITPKTSQLQLNEASSGFTISGDGRFVVFQSAASNGIDGDTNGTADIFLRDTVEQMTHPVSVNAQGQAMGGVDPSVSDDGRFVLFSTDAALIPADSNGVRDVYLVDMQNRQFELISYGASGQSLAGVSRALPNSLSGDGRYATFMSGGGVVEELPNSAGRWQVYLYDRVTQQTRWLSSRANGEIASGHHTGSRISRTGTTVVFNSSSSDLVPEFAAPGIAVYDLATSTARYGNVNNFDTLLQSNNPQFSLSATGRFLTYLNNAGQIHVNDMWKSGLNPYSADSDADGIPDQWELNNGLNPSSGGDLWLDADGDGLPNAYEYAFNSDPLNPTSMSPGVLDGSGLPESLLTSESVQVDFGMYRLAANTEAMLNIGDYVSGLLPAGTVSYHLLTSAYGWMNSDALATNGTLQLQPGFGDVGHYAVSIWAFNASNPVRVVKLSGFVEVTDQNPDDADGDGLPNEFETIYISSLTQDLLTHFPDRDVTVESVSHDGRWLLLKQNSLSWWLFDRESASLSLLAELNGVSQARLSGNGFYVVYQGHMPGSAAQGVVRLDLRDNSATLVSVRSDGTPISGGHSPAVSRNGRYVTFLEYSDDGAAMHRAHLRDLQTLTTYLLDEQGDQRAYFVRDLSVADNGRVAFVAKPVLHMPAEWQPYTGDMVYYSSPIEGVLTRYLDSESKPHISADGTAIAAISGSNTSPAWLLPNQVYRIDLSGLGVELISRNSLYQPANSHVGNVRISDDSRFVYFQSDAGNLDLSGGNYRTNIYAFDQTLGQLERLSVTPGGALTAGHSYLQHVSGNGRVVLFRYEQFGSSHDLIEGCSACSGDTLLLDRWRQALDPANPDTDLDGIPDGWELDQGINPVNGADAGEDRDGDGLTNLEEYLSEVAGQ